MKTFRLIGMALLAIALCINWVSCSSENSDPNTPPSETPTITIDSSIITNGLAFTTEGGEKFISLSSNVDWTLSIASTTGGSTWCTASATSGNKGEATVKFITTENTEYDDRSVAVTIKAGTTSKTFTITQKCKEAILITTNKFEVGQEGGSIAIEVKANIDYQMEISDIAKEWITQSNTRSLTTHNHIFYIAVNEEYEKREGEIYFKNGDKLETVKVYQAGGAVIMLTKNEYTVSDKGEIITVDINSNFEYEVKMPEVDWIYNEAATTRGTSSHRLKYIISPNETYDNRSTQIIYYDKNNTKSADTLTITQAQKDAIIISKKKYEASVKGETIEVELASNIDYTVAISDNSKEWISQVESKVTRALVNNKLYFKIATNSSDKERIGNITISDGKGVSETLTITQEKPSFEFTSDKIYNISSKEKTIEIKFNTNIDYEINIADDGKSWIEQAKDDHDKNSLTHKVYLKITENKETSSRSSKITFIANAVNYIIEITQEGVFNGVVEVKQAGTLPDLLAEKSDTITTLKIIGSLNGTDIAFLRKMAGSNSKGKLQQLDLLDANIVSGGDHYYSIYHSAGAASFTQYYYTKDNELYDYTFYECPLLTSIKLPKTLTKIGMDTFNGCKLESITIPNSVTCYSGGLVFDGCNIKDVYTTDFSSWNESLNFSFPSDGWNLYIDGKLITQLTIPNGITKIRAGAFNNCISLTNVVIPNSITSIGNSTFNGCTRLTSIDIPNSITSIGYRAFLGCTELKNVNFPNGVTSIGEDAFRECKKIQRVVIPNSVTTIEKYAFAECTDLTSIVIGNGLKLIKPYLCYKCTNLTSVTIGNSVTYFGEYSFSSSSIEELHMQIKEPREIHSSTKYYEAFRYTDKNKCILYVPKGYKSAYEKCIFWKDFKNIVEE